MTPLYRQTLTCFIAVTFLLIACSKKTATPPFAINAMNPSSGPDSTQVTIAGAGFSATPSDDLVAFNGKSATVLSATSTSIVARTPTLCGSGNVTVTVNGRTLTAGFFNYDTTWLETILTDTIAYPGMLCLDKSNNLYVTSFLSNVVDKITTADSVSGFVSIPSPLAQTFDAAGNLYVVSNDRDVYKIDPTGSKTLVGTDPYLVFGIAVGRDGSIYLANQFPNSVDKMSPQGVVTQFDSTVQIPSAMAIDHDGKLFVEGTSIVNTTGVGIGIIVSMTQPEATTSFVSHLDYPGQTQMAFDSAGNLYVSDFNQGTVQSAITCITPAGVITSVPVPNIHNIYGIARDQAGNFYASGFQSPAAVKGIVYRLSKH